MLVTARIELCLSDPPQLHTPPGQLQAPPSYTENCGSQCVGRNFLSLLAQISCVWRHAGSSHLLLSLFPGRAFDPRTKQIDTLRCKIFIRVYNKCMSESTLAQFCGTAARKTQTPARVLYGAASAGLAPMITHQRWYRQRPKHHAPPRSHSHAIHYAPSNPFSGGCAPKVSWRRDFTRPLDRRQATPPSGEIGRLLLLIFPPSSPLLGKNHASRILHRLTSASRNEKIKNNGWHCGCAHAAAHAQQICTALWWRMTFLRGRPPIRSG